MAHAERATESERRLLGLALGDATMIRDVAGIDMYRRLRRHADPTTASLVALAALVTVGGSEVSFASTIEGAFAAGADPEEIAGVLVSLVPVVGLATVRDAAGRIVRALGSEPDVQRTFVQIVSEGPLRLSVRSA
jgi:alkylhydroperoxidase/carboxymuconolactone decarboxylase family protein YurZ